MLEPQKFGQQIRAARGEKSQGWLALEISKRTDNLLTKQTVANWESGRNMPTMENFYWLCVVTGMDPNFFMRVNVCLQPTHKRHDRANGSGRRAA